MKNVFTKLTAITLLGLFASAAQAHMLWLERAENGNTFAYFGEANEGLKENAEKLGMFKDSSLVQVEKMMAGTLGEDHILYPSTKDGDVRTSTSVLHKDMLVNFRARNGITETKTSLDYEMTPVDISKGQFKLLLNGEKAVEHSISVVTPELKEIELKTDNEGIVTLDLTQQGNYVIEASYTEEKAGKYLGKDYAKVIYVSTLSFSKK
ncbi:hypothetical protein VQ643_08635 [Pseudomonas sp. F1_0610]|uniref:hypothetical protein n=1 Tax=Pseudomonas sp. F1_0610 TaxID=3114284 RepID=UPI0039C1844A